LACRESASSLQAVIQVSRTDIIPDIPTPVSTVSRTMSITTALGTRLHFLLIVPMLPQVSHFCCQNHLILLCISIHGPIEEPLITQLVTDVYHQSEQLSSSVTTLPPANAPSLSRARMEPLTTTPVVVSPTTLASQPTKRRPSRTS
jgi:hypothetical protein